MWPAILGHATLGAREERAKRTRGERANVDAEERYRRYVLAALTLCYVFNYLDRYVLTILVEPIKAELGVSDAWMGFLIGPAFAVFYTGLGVPVARLADRHVRRSIVAAGGFAVWSAFTGLSGFARGALELTLARIGVGVGEAAGAAPSHSLLSDYFPPERRAQALAVFQTASTSASSWASPWAACSSRRSAGAGPSWRSARPASCSRWCCASPCASPRAAPSSVRRAPRRCGRGRGVPPAVGPRVVPLARGRRGPRVVRRDRLRLLDPHALRARARLVATSRSAARSA